ncbi:MAG: ribosome small subunit-dependent GTPase A [Firmicutes bacterium]|nr:ribosome small subunit-dependent GTPase A [Bacillota bacterium]
MQILKGRIIKGIGGFYYISTPSGVYECRARGLFRKQGITPLVGDNAEIKIIDEEKKTGSLIAIGERKTMLRRPRVANIDSAVIVFAANKPQPDLKLLDSFIILAEEQQLEIVVVFNKTDLDTEGSYKKLLKIYRDAGFRAIGSSTKTGEGLNELKEALSDKLSVLAGPSGVGKSSLINALNPSLSLQTGTLSQKISRGRHTTRHSELLEVFPGGFITDSPGFTSLSLLHIPPEKLQERFREFRPFLGQCYFTGCAHINEPNCAIKAALGEKISHERYERYAEIYNELLEERKYKYD